MHRFRFLPLSLILLCLLHGAAWAQVMIVEAQPGVEALAACQWVQSGPCPPCEWKHIDGVDDLSLILDGELFAMDWTGWGYHLDSGVVLEAIDESVFASGRRRWLETYPERGKVHVSLAWSDADGDSKLSVSDVLTLESGAETVQDVRLHVWVRPVPTK